MFKSGYLDKSKIKILALQLSTFLLLYFISMVNLDRSFYLFRWTADNRYLYIWIPITLLTIFNKKYVAFALTIGNAIGVLLGQFLGDYIESFNMGKITPDMTDEMIWSSGLMRHPGFEIWITTLILALIVGLFWQKIKKESISIREFFSLSKIKWLVLQLLPLLTLYVISRFVFEETIYTVGILYLYIWVPVVILTLLDKVVISFALTVGNIVGVIVGQLLGSCIVKKTTDIGLLEEFALVSNPAFYIWLVIFLLFLVIGIVVQRRQIQEKSSKKLA